MPNLPNLDPAKTKGLGNLSVLPTSFMAIDSIRLHWQAGATMPPPQHHQIPDFLAIDAEIDNPQKNARTLQLIRLTESDAVNQPLKAADAEIEPMHDEVHTRIFDSDWWQKKGVAICLFPDQSLPNPFTTLLWPEKDLTVKKAHVSGTNQRPDLVVKAVEMTHPGNKTKLAISVVNKGASTDQASRTAVIRVSSSGAARLIGRIATPGMAAGETRIVMLEIDRLTEDCRLIFLANAPLPGHPWGALHEFDSFGPFSDTLEVSLPTFSNNAFAIRYHAEPGHQAFHNHSVN